MCLLLVLPFPRAFLLQQLKVLPRQTKHAVRAINQSIFLRCWWSRLQVSLPSGATTLSTTLLCCVVDLTKCHFNLSTLFSLAFIEKNRRICEMRVQDQIGSRQSFINLFFQLDMMRRLRMVNVDHLHVGWYQSAHFGNFLSPQLLESHFAYQTSIDESVCLIFGKKKKSSHIYSNGDNR
jgi:hypothetical protein